MFKNMSSDLSDNALSIIFSNLAKAAEKQQKYEISAAYLKLADSYKKSDRSCDLSSIKEELNVSLTEEYPQLKTLAEEKGDRGVQRALIWGQKVTAIQKSLIDRYLSKGEALTDGKEIYLCEACGFIFLGTETPALCPVCKAPISRFSKIQGVK